MSNAREDDAAAWEAEVRAGIADMDARQGMPLADFEREMDDFMRDLRT